MTWLSSLFGRARRHTKGDHKKHIERSFAAAKLVREDYKNIIAQHFGAAEAEIALLTSGGLQRIADHVLAYRFESPLAIYCGLWPDSSYDVHVERSRNGAVILVSTGFLQAVTDFSYLIMHQAEFDVDDGQPVTPLPHADASRIFNKIIGAARAPAEKSFPLPERLPASILDELSPMTGIRAELVNRVVVSTVGFAVAHEFAHVRLGHLHELPRRLRPDRADDREPLGLSDELRSMANTMFTWSDEIEADIEGLKIMLHGQLGNGNDPYLGITLFSELTDAVFKSADRSRYPHPIQRRTAAISTVHPKHLDAEFTVCDSLLGTIGEIRYGPRLATDWDAADQLYEWSKAFDPHKFPKEEKFEGVHVVRDLPEYIAADFDRSKACVSYFAAHAIRSSRVVSGTSLIRFAFCYNACKCYFADREDWLELDRLIHLAIRDLDRVLEFYEVATMTNWQAPQ